MVAMVTNRIISVFLSKYKLLTTRNSGVLSSHEVREKSPKKKSNIGFRNLIGSFSLLHSLFDAIVEFLVKRNSTIDVVNMHNFR
jgi:hypothetical protein